MIAGYDRYAQIVKCFRDEDLRADRQPEFTQIDVEMSFIDRDDIFLMMEGLMARVFRDVLGEEIRRPVPRMSYREAMDRFGVDKPTPGSGWRSRIARRCCRRATSGSSPRWRLGAASSGDHGPRHGRIEPLRDRRARRGGEDRGGLRACHVQGDRCGLTSSLSKFFSSEQMASLREAGGAKPGDLILVVADSFDVACSSLGRLRLHLGKSSV